MQELVINNIEDLKPIIELVKECGEILKNATMEKEAHEKKDGSLVTKYDLMIDEKLTKGLKEMYGDIPVLSEEHEENLNDTYFVIDPIDGTHNFNAGLEYFGVMLAYIEKNETKFSVIYLPVLDKLFVAMKGKGAFLNGERLKLNRNIDDEQIRFTGCTNLGNKRVLENISKLTNNGEYKFEFRSFYCSCVPVPYVAAGILDFNIFWGPCGLWDIIAPKLILEEAGGLLEYQKIGEGQYEIISGSNR